VKKYKKKTKNTKKYLKFIYGLIFKKTIRNIIKQRYKNCLQRIQQIDRINS
jgi:hypothetical protein